MKYLFYKNQTNTTQYLWWSKYENDVCFCSLTSVCPRKSDVKRKEQCSVFGADLVQLINLEYFHYILLSFSAVNRFI